MILMILECFKLENATLTSLIFFYFLFKQIYWEELIKNIIFLILVEKWNFKYFGMFSTEKRDFNDFLMFSIEKCEFNDFRNFLLKKGDFNYSVIFVFILYNLFEKN